MKHATATFVPKCLSVRKERKQQPKRFWIVRKVALSKPDPAEYPGRTWVTSLSKTEKGFCLLTCSNTNTSFQSSFQKQLWLLPFANYFTFQTSNLMVYFKPNIKQEWPYFPHMAPAPQIAHHLSNVFLAFKSKSLPNLHHQITNGCPLPWGLQEKSHFHHLHRPVSHTVVEPVNFKKKKKIYQTLRCIRKDSSLAGAGGGGEAGARISELCHLCFLSKPFNLACLYII